MRKISGGFLYETTENSSKEKFLENIVWYSRGKLKKTGDIPVVNTQTITHGEVSLEALKETFGN